MESRAKGHGARTMMRALAIIVSALGLALVCINAFVFFSYPAFFAEAQRAFSIPGIESGFVPQDIDLLDEQGCWLFSGYAAEGGPSPVYVLDAEGATRRFFIEDVDGTPYAGHGSAITSTDSHVYLACEGGYLVLEAAGLSAAADGATVRALGKVDLDFSPAFMNIEDDCLYAGNFYHPGSYETDAMFHVQTPSGSMNRSVIYLFQADPNSTWGFSEVPANAYSIPDRIQGVAMRGNTLLLSQSYGLASSHILAFDLGTMTTVQEFQTSLGAVPLTVLDEGLATLDLALPPMSEGIESHEGRLYVSFESASNKYVFGKLYGAGAVYSLPLA